MNTALKYLKLRLTELESELPTFQKSQVSQRFFKQGQIDGIKESIELLEKLKFFREHEQEDK